MQASLFARSMAVPLRTVRLAFLFLMLPTLSRCDAFEDRAEWIDRSSEHSCEPGSGGSAKDSAFDCFESCLDTGAWESSRSEHDPALVASTIGKYFPEAASGHVRWFYVFAKPRGSGPERDSVINCMAYECGSPSSAHELFTAAASRGGDPEMDEMLGRRNHRSEPIASGQDTHEARIIEFDDERHHFVTWYGAAREVCIQINFVNVRITAAEVSAIGERVLDAMEAAALPTDGKPAGDR